MNCAECERLFDAYLDGQLAGSLRLELDAHRLRCRRCQQTLAMLEAVEHVIASDHHVPALSRNFTDRVMAGITRRRLSGARRTGLRVAIAAGAVVQAAAVLVFAVILWPKSPPAPAPSGASGGGVTVSPGDFEAEYARIADYIESRVEIARLARQNVTTDLGQLTRFASAAMTLPDEVTREAIGLGETNPLLHILNSVLPAEPDVSEPAPAKSGRHSL